LRAFTLQTLGADTLDDIFRLDYVIPLWYGNSRNRYVFKAYRLMTLYAREMYVPLMLMVVSVMAVTVIIVQAVANAVFLHSGTVVDGMYQLLLGK
jgi:hypothetical protein